jgi:hypothetical protein
MPIAELDPAYENRHIFYDADANPHVRESLSWPIPLPQHDVGLIIYTWVHAQGSEGRGRAGASAVAYGPDLPAPIIEVIDEVSVPDEMGFERWEVGPIKIAMPGGNANPHLFYEGDSVAVDCTFEPLHPAFAYGQNPGGCPPWLAQDRVEQGGRYRGTVRVGDRVIEVDSLGQRDHSWGMRDWGAALHWKWWNVFAAPDMALHVMEIQAFGQNTVHGYVHKDGLTASVIGLDSDYELDDRFMHTSIDAVFHDDDGRETVVRATQGADLEWPISTRLTLHEAAMHAEIDGHPGVAQMEMTWPPDYIAYHRQENVGSMYANLDALTLDKS